MLSLVVSFFQNLMHTSLDSSIIRQAKVSRNEFNRGLKAGGYAMTSDLVSGQWLGLWWRENSRIPNILLGPGCC